MTEATATAAVSAFEGLSGAFALTLIAFTIVFLVLGGLTGVIYAMRLITEMSKKKSRSAELVPPAPAPAGKNQDGDSDELIAVISAAIAAELGGNAVVRAVFPCREESGDGWTLCARMESLGRLVVNHWN